MPITATMIKHSRCTAHKVELYTLEVVLPRCLVAQFNTHRQFSRNSASSRAIPIATLIDTVLAEPYVPDWHQNAKGMMPAGPLDPGKKAEADGIWDAALKDMAYYATELAELGCAKEDVNRMMEAFAWSTILVTATDWKGFFAQRLPGAGAQDGIAKAALKIQEAMSESTPQELEPGEWHIPYGGTLEEATAHCARVSYTKHGTESTPERLQALFERLTGSRPGHWSPSEHVARALPTPERCRNFRGWQQLRAVIDQRVYEEG